MTTNQAQAGIWGPMSATDDVLTEVAAVAVQWAEAIDRRAKRGTP